MKYSKFDYRFAKTILGAHHMGALTDIESILEETQMPLGRGHRPTPSQVLQEKLKGRGWQTEKKVGKTELRFDGFKDRVAVEIETTDPSDVINECLKFRKADLMGELDVGILIVYDDSIKGDNIPTITATKNSLITYSELVPTPIWIIGLR